MKIFKFVMAEWLPLLFLGICALVVIAALLILTNLLGGLLGTIVWVILWLAMPAIWCFRSASHPSR